MKKIILTSLVMLLFTTSFICTAADISISGDTYVCPGISYTYTASASNIFGSQNGCFQFSFYVDNVLIWASPNNDCDCARQSSTDSEPIIWPHVSDNARVIVSFVPRNTPGCDESVKTKNIIIRLAPPVSISGDYNICPGGTKSFSVPPINHATSYTWEVPANWSVNGIPGPVVTGQWTNANITSQGVGSGDNFIRVRGVSSTCGSSDWLSRYVQLDYVPKVTVSTSCSSQPEFDAATSGAVSYYWEVPSSWWIMDGQGTASMIAYNFNNSGFVTVLTETICGNTTQGYMYYDVSMCGYQAMKNSNMKIHPNPVNHTLIVHHNSEGAPNEGTLTLMNGVNEIISIHEIKNEKQSIDMTSLKPGIYYLKYQAQGRMKVYRIVKK